MRKGNRRIPYPKRKTTTAKAAPTGKTIRWKRAPYPKGWARKVIAYYRAKPRMDRDDLMYAERTARFNLSQKLQSELADLRNRGYTPPPKSIIRWKRRK